VAPHLDAASEQEQGEAAPKKMRGRVKVKGRTHIMEENAVPLALLATY